MMKKNIVMRQILLIIMFVLSPFMLAAQPQGQPQDGSPRFDPQKFQQMVEQMLTKAGELTADEAQLFFPLYNEMRQKQREMGRQIHELKTSCPADSKACSETILKIKRLQVESAELEQDYYKRILRKLPAEKLFKMMKAEDDFHRRMVKREGQQRHDKKGRNNSKKAQQETQK